MKNVLSVQSLDRCGVNIMKKKNKKRTVRKQKKRKRINKNRENLNINYWGKNDIEPHIPSIMLNVYLIPIAKMSLIIWLMVSGELIAGFSIYFLFGLQKLFNFIRFEESEIDNWIIPIIFCVFLWPAFDILTFIPPPKDTDF